MIFNMGLRLLLLAIFGLAMAHFEGVVVVYLRKCIGMEDGDSNKDAALKITDRLLKIERSREAATIIMLVAIAILSGNTWPERAILFLWTFAFWDLFYYLSLYVLIKWPPKLTATDVLFLIPRPWIAPVWFPVTVSAATILTILVLFILGIVH